MPKKERLDCHLYRIGSEKNETLIDLLAITEEEQQQLQTIISKR